MGYFDRSAEPPPIPAPAETRIWGEGTERALTWRRPLGGCDGFVVLRGATPEALIEVARLPPAATRWPVPAEGGPWLAVACVRGSAAGEPGALMRLDGPAHAPPAQAPSAQTAELFGHGRAGEGSALAETPPREPNRAGWNCTRPERPSDPGRAPEAPGLIGVTSTPGPWCGCCSPARPLAPGEGALRCPGTGELYAVLATGALARAAELPFGLCRCCEARQPLMRCEGAVVCLARPEQGYRREGDQYLPVAAVSEPVVLADAAAIDAALRANSALLGVNGIFISEGAHEWRRRH